jgi:hypothetical protein
MVVLKVKIVQECKKPKVEMYKPIWGLVFKCNVSGIQFNSHKNITIKEMWEKEKKRSNKNTRCNRVQLKKCLRLRDSQPPTIEVEPNSFTLVELGPLHKNRLSSLSVTKVTTHSKRVSDNTLKNKKWVITR